MNIAIIYRPTFLTYIRIYAYIALFLVCSVVYHLSIGCLKKIHNGQKVPEKERVSFYLLESIVFIVFINILSCVHGSTCVYGTTTTPVLLKIDKSLQLCFRICFYDFLTYFWLTFHTKCGNSTLSML